MKPTKYLFLLLLIVPCHSCSSGADSIPTYVELEAANATTAWLLEHHGRMRSPQINRVAHRVTRRLSDAVPALSLITEGEVRFDATTGWRTFILNSEKANAFSVPGRSIFITRGLLQQMRSESELAAVIAHEMAHHVLGHTTRAMKQTGLSTGVPRYFFSLDQELAADTVSIEILSIARYEIRSAIHALTIAYRPVTRIVSQGETNWLDLRAANLQQTVSSTKSSWPGTFSTRAFTKMKKELAGAG